MVRSARHTYNLFTVVYYIFYQFRGLTPPKYGRAAASTVILFVVIFIFTRIQIWIQKIRSLGGHKMRTKNFIKYSLIYIILGIGAVFMIFPFFWMIMGGFKTAQEISAFPRCCFRRILI